MMPLAAIAAVDPHYLRGLVVGGVFGAFGGTTFGLLIGAFLNAVGRVDESPDPAILDVGAVQSPARSLPRPRHSSEAHRNN